jgi:hypothetical protein
MGQMGAVHGVRNGQSGQGRGFTGQEGFYRALIAIHEGIIRFSENIGNLAGDFKSE